MGDPTGSGPKPFWAGRRLLVLAALAFVATVGGILAGAIALTRDEPGDGPVVVVSDWDLVTAAGPVPVELPARVTSGVRAGSPSFALTTRVTLPEALRGRPLTLGLAFSWGQLELTADGEAAPAVDQTFLGLERSRGPYLFRIDPAATADGVVDLELRTILYRGMGTWFDVAPRLSAAPQGDARYRLVRLFNDASAGAALIGLLMVALIYGTAWLFDRSRTAAFYALSSDFATFAPLFALGIAQPLLGRWELVVFSVAFWVSGVTATHYLHAAFELKPPPRALWWSIPVVAAAAVLLEELTRKPVWLAVLLLVIGAPLALHLAALHLRARRSPRHRTTATLSMVAWGLFVALLVPEALADIGLGRYTWGLHPLSLGVMLYSMGQATVVAYDRVAAARATAALTDELRHQVAERSRQLADALARLDEAPKASARLVPGELVEDRYEVVRALGAGGMGTVYEVERRADGRRLALKLLSGAPTPAAMARFAREAQIAAELDHPNLVPVHDVGISRSGSMFLVMELVEGGSLEQQRARFGEVAWAMPLLGHVAAGMAAMHGKGMVHRDLKPANVLVEAPATGAAPRARIADFGIASLGAPAAAGDLDAFAATAAIGGGGGSGGLTRPGMILGTPAYMAPEMITGAEAASAAVDVFAFGVMAYELLTGDKPFAMPPYLAHMGGQAATPATPLPRATGARAGHAKVPEAVAALVDRCLALDPARRPTAAELVKAFTAA